MFFFRVGVESCRGVVPRWKSFFLSFSFIDALRYFGHFYQVTDDQAKNYLLIANLDQLLWCYLNWINFGADLIWRTAILTFLAQI